MSIKRSILAHERNMHRRARTLTAMHVVQLVHKPNGQRSFRDIEPESSLCVSCGSCVGVQ
jgi:hypothetical protein